MTRVVRTYSFDEIRDIVSEYAQKEWERGNFSLTEKNGNNLTRLNTTIVGNDLTTLTMRVFDENA